MGQSKSFLFKLFLSDICDGDLKEKNVDFLQYETSYVLTSDGVAFQFSFYGKKIIFLLTCASAGVHSFKVNSFLPPWVPEIKLRLSGLLSKQF